MQTKFRLFRRANGQYYREDRQTGQRFSLSTTNKAEATQLLAAENQKASQPHLNLSMAKVYLAGSRPELITRTWNDAAKEIEAGYEGPTLARWRKFSASEPIQHLLKTLIIQTVPEDFLNALRHERAGVSTNVWLRILHNRAVDLGWLLQPVMARRVWPKIHYNKRRAITTEEHDSILAVENLPEYKLYYQLLWELGASQTDVARLRSSNINWNQNRITFQRAKLTNKGKGITVISFGEKIRAILLQLPQNGFLFPNLAAMREDTRASHFAKVCIRAGVSGVTLHCYRYAWAVRAKKAGMPLREAMTHLGHSSRAIHIAYADDDSGASVPLEYYEEQMKQKIINFNAGNGASILWTRNLTRAV